jgi:hypothetical protein
MKDTNCLVEVFRTGEATIGYITAVTITYFMDVAHIHGFSGKPTIACFRELKRYLKNKGIRFVYFSRKDSEGKLRKICIELKDVYGN